jgi:hypothetical protein
MEGANQKDEWRHPFPLAPLEPQVKGPNGKGCRKDKKMF